MKKTLMAIATSCLITVSASALFAGDLSVAGDASLDKKGTLEISGTGFAAQQPILLLFTTKDGVVSDISYALDPAPKADADGNWSTIWSYGRFVKKKLVGARKATFIKINIPLVKLLRCWNTYPVMIEIYGATLV